MRNERLTTVGFLFLMCLCCRPSPSGAGCQEPATTGTLSSPTELDVVVPIKDRGGLAAFVKSANSSRYSILTEDFDYKVLSEEIAKVYNGSSSGFSSLVRTVFSYCTGVIVIGGFLFLASVMLPVTIVTLWMVWGCCCEENEDEDEDNRNLTIKAQIIAWTLGIVLILVLATLTAFVVLLLIGNTWVSQGTAEGASVVNSTLPLLAKLKSDTLSQVQDIVISQYDNEVASLIEYASSVPGTVKQKLSDLYGSNITTVLNDVQNELTAVYNLSHDVSQLSALHDGLPQLNLLPSLANLTAAMLALVQRCNSSLTLGQLSQSLYTQCVNLTHNVSLLVPMPSNLLLSNFSALGGVDPPTGSRILSLLVVALSMVRDVPERNITEHINVTSSAYFNTIRNNLSQFVSMVEGDYSGVTFGLPKSESQLQDYLGTRNLDNWKAFIFSTIIIFSAAVFGFIVSLFVAMARGLINILLIYRYGDDMSYIEAAHQSGIFMRKLSCVYSFVPLIAAIISTAALCTGGVLGNICGPYSNFTNLLDKVFDNPATWNNTYPLGAEFVGDPRVSLTVRGLLEDCWANRSLFFALRQDLRYNIGTSITIPDQLARAYVEDMRSVVPSTKLILLSPEVLTQLCNASRLGDYHVLWDDYKLLNGSELWQDQRFGGINTLETFLAVFGSNNPLQNFTAAAVSALASFKTNFDIYQSQLPNIHWYAMVAQQQQKTYSDAASHLIDITADVMSGVVVNTASISNTQLTQVAVQTNFMLNSYETAARSELQCGLGTCSSLPSHFAGFSSAVCGGVVGGLDLLWTSLFAICSCTLAAVLLTVTLAGRLIDVQLERNKQNRFDLTEAGVNQLLSALRQLVGVAVSLWFVVVVFEGRGLYDNRCGPDCCYVCMEAFGAAFLSLSALTGGAFHGYQGVVLYRLHKLESSNAKARRFWLERKKSVHFYGQLCQFFLQDIPFLVLAGYYTQQTGVLNVAAFFTLAASLLGLLGYLVYLCKERTSIPGYLMCLRGEASDCWAKLRVGGVARQPAPEPGLTASSLSQRPHRSPYGSSESEQSDESQATYQEDHGFEFVRAARNQQRLSDIQEEQHEGTSVSDQVTSGDPGAAASGGHNNQHEIHAGAEQRNPFSTVTLDHAVDLVNGDLVRGRQEVAIMMKEMGGVDVADPYCRQTDAESSTTRSGSYYGSSNSITASEVPGYCSSSHAPDEIEMSDQREDYDYDSEHSQRRYVHRIKGLTAEMSVEV